MIGDEPDWTSERAQMILTIHNIARTYKLLPSQVLDSASTFDLFVLDTYHRYQQFMEKKNSTNAQAPIAKPMSIEAMKAKILKARSAETLSRFKK